MPIRITGMNSNLDTESIIQELIKVERTKVDKLKKEQTKLQWKQDAWKDLNSKMKSLFNKTVTNLMWPTSYSKKTTSVSNSSAVSVITGANAMNGVQELKIIQQAKTGFLTGKQLSENGAYTASSKLSEIAPGKFGAGESGVFNITSGGKTTEIKVNGDTTISDVLTQLKKAGVNASFDEKNQRLFVLSKEAGEANDFALTASDAAGQSALEALGINASLADDKAALKEYTEFAGYYVAGDKAATLDNMKGMIGKETASRVAAYKKSTANAKSSIESVQKKIDKITGKDGYDPSATADSIQTKIDDLKKDMETMTEDEKKAAGKTLSELETQLADVKQVDSYKEEIFKNQKIIADNEQYITIDADGNAAATGTLITQVEDAYYNKASFAKDMMDAYNAGTLTGGAKKIPGQDAKITLNGEDFTSTSNVFEVNGLTFTVLAETSDPITVTTQDDTDGIYDMVKSFLKEYNALINEMDKLYNAETAKGYEPLTDEEKSEMSEGDIEKWEQKIKDSIMRRDSSLSTVSNMMVGIMSAGVEVNGQKMFLSNFGINTLSYFESGDNEKHAYHIDGDPDNENTTGKTDKLKTAIANNPDSVMNFFIGLAKNLNEGWKKVSATNEFSSYNSAYNDKLMKQQYTKYTSKIEKQEERLTAMEDKWYAKFTAMETALAKLQSNQSAVSALLGGM